MSKKIIIYPLVLSIICHYLFLYSDRIYNHLFLVLTTTEKQNLSIIEKNIEKLNKLKKEQQQIPGQQLGQENLSELMDKFQEEKEQYLSKVADSHGKNQGTGNDKQGNSKGIETAIVDQQFSKFSSKNQSLKEVEPEASSSNKKFTISIIPKNSYKIPTKCEASYYGIGLILQGSGMVSGISEFSNVARKLDIKVGDYLLGFKNTDNTFYEGNKLIPLIQKNYKNEELTIILKQDGKIVERSIVLDSICYEKKPGKI